MSLWGICPTANAALEWSRIGSPLPRVRRWGDCQGVGGEGGLADPVLDLGQIRVGPEGVDQGADRAAAGVAQDGFKLGAVVMTGGGPPVGLDQGGRGADPVL